ncbi:MAG: PPOX class F420-dependent oxidoreductase [Solirubrobacterales bacterium]
MTVPLTDAQKAVIDGKNFAHVATHFPNGTVQVNPVWIDRDGDTVQINSAEGRAKVENLRNDPRITIEVSDHANPYNYVEIRGRAVEFTNDGADDHIDALAKKYMGVDTYPLRQDGEVRVTIKIEADKALGGDR